MISVIEAQRILHDNLPSPERITVPIEEAFGLYLFEDIKAPDSSPRYTNSAMDGYAVKASDTFGASQSMPGYLDIGGEVVMGETPIGTVALGTCFKIPTGGILPDGADAARRVAVVRHHRPGHVLRPADRRDAGRLPG